MPKFSNYCFGRNDRHFCVFLFCFVTRASVWIEVFLTACLSSHVFRHQVTNYVENGRGSGSKKQATHLAVCPFPKLGWPHFLLLVSLCSFFCVDLLLSFFFFFLLLFPWVLLASQGTRIFPQNMVLKAEPLFPATGNERGGWVMVELGWGLTSWLPVQGLCQCEKKQRRLIWWLWKCVCPRERVQLD